MMASDSERQRRIVVTGAAQGIGRGAVERFLAEGDSVLGVDVNGEKLAEVSPLGADTLVADLADPAGRAAVTEAAAGCDGLVNAAGIIILKKLRDVTVEDWRRIVQVNVESIFFLCQGIGPTMPAGGAVVNLSSSSGKLTSTTEAGIYAATKCMILSVTRSFAYELAHIPVRVNAICPGIVDTPMQDKVLAEVAPLRGVTPEELSAARTQVVPLGRGSTPAEISGLISFLLGPDSAYMTGQSINHTGGLVMW
ncbi:MAG: SDR family NAD(P)-dependent oxidoreductase [bacterium]|nr:SDR family NAD(P)-dependent oxidoreductase [bacterium]MCY3924130.1 SDR family NAD(P)-dependent oxidoreductase [bacterium]